MPRLLRLALFAAVTAAAPAQDPPHPATKPEATGYAETSSLADVQRFLDACVRLPHGDRLAIEVAGKSYEGRPLLLVKASLGGAPTPPRLRALITANIHAGEVEGKEALQQLVREIAGGGHEDVLAAFDLWLLPVYNPDGNEKTKAHNRGPQNGPTVTGQRSNGQGLDLNRDFVKAEAPETRALLALFLQHDPHLYMDLHTTNGSYHGYHLTYSPCLSLNTDPGLVRLSRALLDDVTRTMQGEHGFLLFDYGNFRTGDWDKSGMPESPHGVRGWFSHDSRPRYGINYYGLRNRIAFLAEGYSYCDFETRIATMHAFVLTTLRALAARRDEVANTCTAADARPLGDERLWFGFDQCFAPAELLDVLVGEVDREDLPDGSHRLVRKDVTTAERMPVRRAFAARQRRALPAAWAVVQPAPEVVQLLQRHGIEFEAVSAPRQVQAERFAVAKVTVAERAYQGHQPLTLAGAWQPAATCELPLGTLIVSTRQRLALLAAQLLEPESDEGLAQWNLLAVAAGADFPVLRLVE
jgi:hypothetical protein